MKACFRLLEESVYRAALEGDMVTSGPLKDSILLLDCGPKEDLDV